MISSFHHSACRESVCFGVKGGGGESNSQGPSPRYPWVRSPGATEDDIVLVVEEVGCRHRWSAMNSTSKSALLKRIKISKISKASKQTRHEKKFTCIRGI